jgi:hypothetical protein
VLNLLQLQPDPGRGLLAAHRQLGTRALSTGGRRQDHFLLKDST